MECEKISLAKFLSRFYMLDGERLKKLTHNDVRVLFPNLERLSFEDALNNTTGRRIFLVYDGHRTIPYYEPIILNVDEPEILNVNGIDNDKFQVDDTHYNYSSLSVSQLRLLLVRKLNSTRNQLEARKEIDKRIEHESECGHKTITLKKKYDRNEFRNIDMED